MLNLDLPSDREIGRWVLRHGLPIDRGTRGASVHYRSRQRFVGRGERLGLTDKGRVSDYLPLLSAVRREPTYRRTRIAPKRRIMMVVDLRFADDARSLQRLLSSAVLLGGVVLGLPDATLSITAAGTEQPVFPTPYQGLQNLSLVRRSIAALADVRYDPIVSPAKFRFICLSEEGVHLLFVSHFLHKTMVEKIPFSLGATVLHVQPPSGWFGLLGGGINVSAGLEPGVAAGDVMKRRYRESAEYFSTRHVRTYTVAPQGSSADAISAALLGKGH